MKMNHSNLRDMADAVREAYIVNDMHPSDMVEELARANDLNPEQIKRLCEASNMAIKDHLRKGKVDDVMFPLASSYEVLGRMQPGEEVEAVFENEVTASLAPESRLREFARFYLTGKGSGMKKTASFHGDPIRSLTVVLSETTKRASAKRMELGEAKLEAEKLAGRIIESLSDEARVNRNINSSYTALKECIPDNEVVDPMYKVAHKMICEGLRFPYPEPEIVKIAGKIPNPRSAMVAMFEKYASALARKETLEAEYKELEERVKQAREDIRDIIIKEAP